MYVMLFLEKKLFVCNTVLCLTRQFYADNLRSLLICRQLVKGHFVDSSVDRRPVDNSPTCNDSKAHLWAAIFILVILKCRSLVLSIQQVVRGHIIVIMGTTLDGHAHQGHTVRQVDL